MRDHKIRVRNGAGGSGAGGHPVGLSSHITAGDSWVGNATLEDMIELARPFDGRSAFGKSDLGAYSAAKRRGWLDDIAAALGWPKNKSHKS